MKLSENVAGRITPEEKEKMKQLKFTVRHAIQLTILHYMDPKKKIQLLMKKLKEELLELKLDVIAKEMQIEELEKEYNKLKGEK